MSRALNLWTMYDETVVYQYINNNVKYYEITDTNLTSKCLVFFFKCLQNLVIIHSQMHDVSYS